MSLRSFSARTFAARTYIPIWGLQVAVSAAEILVCIREALETALAGITPALSTAFENASFLPVLGTAYQRAWLLFAKPDNLVMGRGWRELGIFQVDLCYPLDNGSVDAAARAQLLVDTFYKGATFSSCGISVVVEKTPEVRRGRNEGTCYVVPVRIRFFVNGLT